MGVESGGGSWRFCRDGFSDEGFVYMKEIERVDDAYAEDFLGGSSRVINEMVLRYLCC